MINKNQRLYRSFHSFPECFGGCIGYGMTIQFATERMITGSNTRSPHWPKNTPKSARSSFERQRALRRYGILDTSPEPEFSDLAMLAAEIFKAPFAAITFSEGHRQWFKAGVGIEICEIPIDQAFCQYALRSAEPFIVRDARQDPEFARNPLVTSAPGIRFYAGMRLLANDGTAIGAVCVFDDKPRPLGISKLERKALLVLAGQVQSFLELRRSLIEREKEVAFKKALTLKLRQVADHDSLTGLPHRGPFHAQLNKISCPANDGTDRIALILVDIDHFKQVNDALGHDVGDTVLRSLAQRLRAIVREGDIVARLGGDEFGILMYGVKSEQALSEIVSSFNTRLQHSVKCNGRHVECHVSVGIATYPDQATTAEELVKHSDLALAAAKSVRSCAVHFDPSMALEFEQETAMLSFARSGLAEGRIVPYYQPKIDLRTNRVVGFEALVRYVHNAETILLPGVFSHAFNDLKLARALGTEMLTRVLNDIAAWSSEGSMDFSVAINTSAADFNSDDFAERLIAELTARKLKPHQIEIEVTEGVFLGRGADHVARALRCLHNYGVRIALDDFGTGYGCLTHLKQFPIDIIKIDRSFVAGIAKNPDDTSIVKALIGLGQSLGIQTIAEGVETTQQKDFVRRHGCTIAQGFLFGRAIEADRVIAEANPIGTALAC